MSTVFSSVKISVSKRTILFTNTEYWRVRSHYPETASALDFKDAATPRFGPSDVAFDLFTETRFCV